MNLTWTPEEIRFREMVRAFAADRLPRDIRDKVRRHQRLERDDYVRWHNILADQGWGAPNWPVEHGGTGWNALERLIFEVECFKAGAPRLLPFGLSMIGPVLMKYGSAAQQARFLPRMPRVQDWWCQGYSEPGAGSDLASVKTTAVRDGDHYIVNGQKTWTTLGQYADWIFCLVRTNPDVKKQAGISFLLIDLDTPGIEMRPIKLIDGSVEVNEVFFNDVKVPVENLVGEENAGWTYAKFLLGNERTGIARVGWTKTKLAEAKKLAAATKTANGTLLEDPLFAARLAELETELLALEVTQLRVVAGSADGKPNPISSLVKLRGSELQQSATELLADVAGARGLAVDAPGVGTPEWAQLAVPEYLNYRKVTIYGGSSEVQRSIISSSILGL